MVRLLHPIEEEAPREGRPIPRPGDVRIEDAPEPIAGPGEVKIRVRNCSTCGTDVKISSSGHHHIAPPRVMGHEIAGEIVEVGADVDGLGSRATGSRSSPRSRADVRRSAGAAG